MKTVKQITKEAAALRRCLYIQIILDIIGCLFLGALWYAIVVLAFCL